MRSSHGKRDRLSAMESKLVDSPVAASVEELWQVFLPDYTAIHIGLESRWHVNFCLTAMETEQ